jgi:hypothetical protein
VNAWTETRVAVSGRSAFVPVRLELHAEALGHPVHVVEVGHDLVGVDDVALRQAGVQQGADVVLLDGGRVRGQRKGVRV